jgi:hypothetical protein
MAADGRFGPTPDDALDPDTFFADIDRLAFGSDADARHAGDDDDAKPGAAEVAANAERRLPAALQACADAADSARTVRAIDAARALLEATPDAFPHALFGALAREDHA